MMHSFLQNRCKSGGKRSRNGSNHLPKLRDKKAERSKEQQCIKIVSKIECKNRTQKHRHNWLTIENAVALKKKVIPPESNNDCLLTAISKFVIT